MTHACMRKHAICAALLFLLPAKQAAAASGQLLSRAGEQVARFLDQFSDLKCTEDVTQAKLGKNRSKQSIEYREQQTFDYLLLAHGSGDDLVIQESRLQQRSSGRKASVPLLVTNGFATLSLIFHPSYQSAFEFSPSENDTLNGRKLAKIRFRHLRGRRTPTVLVLRGREYPLELKGTAWIDPATATIVRLQAELQEDMSDIGLRTLRSEVEYAPVHFRSASPADIWLPSVATIELETPKQHWRNIHRFTNYQQFSVSTDNSVKTQ